MQPVPAPFGAPPRWWEDGDNAVRFVADLVAAELSRLRPGAALPAPPWQASCDLARDLGVDSLERIALASALSAALHLHRSGLDDALGAGRTIGEWAAAASAGLALYSQEITFHTSGSAGQPKPCRHTLGALWDEAAELAALLPGTTRVLCAAPSHHIYGFLFSILLPRALGIGPGDVRDLRAGSPSLLARSARAGDLVVTHPAYWRAALVSAAPFAPGVTGVTSTAPCPPDLAEALLAHGLARLLQVYGSSETGGVGWRDSHAQPYTTFSCWRRDPTDPAVLLRDGGAAGRYRLQDLLAWHGERQFVPTGRIDEAVQVGGINVFPERVAQVLRAHPAVAEAAVRLMRSDEGSRLKAFVVAHPGAAAAHVLRDELRQFASARLSAPELPAAVSFGAALPRTANGKLSDWIIDAGGDAMTI